jgi:glycosyltransferase involved in cell wall biosynthesis
MADVGDVDAMADAALRILRNRDLYVQMGAAGRAAAVGRFHPSRIVPQYIQAYERTALGVTV